MKKLLNNRIFALLLCVVVVVSSTVISTSVKLNKKYDALTESFFVRDSGKPAGYYVNSQLGYASSIATVAGHYDALVENASSIRSARTVLRDAYEEQDIEAMLDAYNTLRRRVSDMEDAAETVSLSAEDRSTFLDAVNGLDGAQRAIETGYYTSNVNDYFDLYYNLPRFIRRTINLHYPVYYFSDTEYEY